ncbi:MAG: caspase family protein [Myxococcota bacterium]
MSGRAQSAGCLLTLGLVACAASGRDKGELVRVPGLSPEVVMAQARPRKIALLVGVDHFSDAFWPGLLYAGKDAQDLGGALKSPEVGGFDEVRVLTGPEHTTKHDVLAAIDGLSALAPRPDDLVVLYVSAHGTLAEDPVRGLVRVIVLTDTRRSDLLGSGLGVDDLVARFDALPSKRKTLILATCHSGSGKSLLPPEVVAELKGTKGPVPLEWISSASLILSAADLGQAAREDDRLQNDVYTHFFVEALGGGADANGDGAISATEAHEYARARTYEFTGGKQVPTVQATIAGADPVLLAGHLVGPGRPVLAGYAARLLGLRVSVDGRDKGVFPGTIVLEPGSRAVELRRPDGALVSSAALELSPGQIFDAESMLEDQRRRWELGLRAGVLGFFSPGVDSGVARPLPMFGLGAVLRRVLWDAVDLGLDASFGTLAQAVRVDGSAVDQQLSALELGASLSYAGALGPLHLGAGPRLSYLVLFRSVGPAALNEHQGFGALLPGLELSLALDLGRLELQLRGRAEYLPLVLDNQVRSFAALSAFFGTGVRF